MTAGRHLRPLCVLLAASAFALASGVGPVAAADFWCGEDATASAWSAGYYSACAKNRLSEESGEAANAAIADPDVAPAQLLTIPPTTQPFRQPVRTTPANARPALRGAAVVGLASVPYMIGDTGSGTCLDFDGLIQAGLSHPSLTCSRLNIAEANSAIPMDRLYYSYRHFHNSNTISAYSFSDTLDLDRHLIAWEKTFWDGGGSVELRLPIEQRIRSDIFSVVAPNFGVVDPLVAPGDGRATELGNIAAIFKYLLWAGDYVWVSGGLGVTLPTARDVDYHLVVDGQIVFPSNPGLTADEQAAFEGVFANETVYLEPFLAWLIRPAPRWYHQGFMQVETAANPSRVTFNGDGATLFSQNGVPIGFYDYYTPVPVRAPIFSQTLLRLNLGAGYAMVQDPGARWLQQLVGIFEMHYTTTLNNANMTDIPLTAQSSVGTVPLQTITLGNGDNRVDILNAAAGVSANMGRWIITNGAIAPIRRSPDRGFDFEYNVQVQRLF